VSLPQETFTSSGASVKASLLFMQKFTEAEQQDFDVEKAAAKAEIDAKYAEEIEAETDRLNEAIATAKADNQTEARKALQKELRIYLKRMETLKQSESRALLKERFPYPIFLYNADKVGISATGEADQNELYPNDNQPSDIETTCLELHQEFRTNAEKFLLSLEESIA